jgi:hypothetical protein
LPFIAFHIVVRGSMTSLSGTVWKQRVTDLMRYGEAQASRWPHGVKFDPKFAAYTARLRVNNSFRWKKRNVQEFRKLRWIIRRVIPPAFNR